MTLQIAEISARSDPALLQIAEISAVATVDTTTSLLQISDISAVSSQGSGVAPVITGGTVKIGGAVILAGRGGQQVDLAITITGSYDTVTWSVLTGSVPVLLAGSALAASFIVPYTADGGDVLIGVRATGTGGTSAERRLTVSIVPHASPWYLDDDGVWTPARSSLL